MDATNKMLEALVDRSAPEATTCALSTDEQLKYLCKNINLVPLETKIDLGRVVKLNGCSALMMESPDGLILNLDRLAKTAPHVISTMYEILSHKIDLLRV